jgi:hypothetical protein
MLFKHVLPRRLIPVFVILGVIIILVGCGKDKSTTAVPDNGPSDVNAYLNNLPKWNNFAHVKDTADIAYDDSITADMSNLVLCTSTPCSITQNPQKIVTFGEAPNVLYLGSLIQGNSYSGGLGSIMELPIRQRAPLIIGVNLFSGTDIMDTVIDPNAASVQASLNTIISNAANSGHQSGIRMYYKKEETYSLDQVLLKLGMSFKFLDVDARAKLDYTATSQQKTVTAFYEQVMYEAYIVRPQTPAQFFSADFTMEKLNEQINLGNIGPGNPPVYVDRIQYGRIMIFTMTSTADVESMMMAIEGSYSGFGSFSAEVEASLRNILNTSECRVAAVGGTESTIESMLRSGSLGDYFANVAPITSAVPLAYTVISLDGSVAVFSETTSYDKRECSAVNAVGYTNKTEWQTAVADLVGPGHVVEFPTSANNIRLSNEVPIFFMPGPNYNLGNVLTWEPAWTYFPFTFSLKASDPGYKLVFDDQESGDPAFSPLDQQRSISIGDVDDQQNDDFDIEIPEWNSDVAVFAIGMTIGSNVCESGEEATVYGISNFQKVLDNTCPDCPTTHGFLGVISTVPLTKLHFNEGSGGDDIFVRDFYFGVLNWSH